MVFFLQNGASKKSDETLDKLISQESDDAKQTRLQIVSPVVLECYFIVCHHKEYLASMIICLQV